MEEVLIIDGYNIIGAWPELRILKEKSLEEARDRLIDAMADYQAFSGKKLILVFDAYQVPGLGGKYKQSKLEIRYTKEKETADEMIERLVSELKKRRRIIQVATSDSAEQSLTFGMGALRVSSRELLIQLEESQKKITKTIRERHSDKKNSFDSNLSQEAKRLFEQWRRGNPD